MKNNNILFCMGTRPEVIKMAPVYHAFAESGMNPLLLHTGQHQDMAQAMYEFFNIVPNFTLNLIRESDRLCHLSSLILEKLGAIITEIRPSAVLVHGDTTSAVMAALAAFYQKIPVGHVEAGLRSHHNYDPFPEEKNREMISRLAQWHFAPTEQAQKNLLSENIRPANIHMVGNTIVDAVRMTTTVFNGRLENDPEIHSGVLQALPLQLQSKRLVVVTTHRRENLGDPLLSITKAIRKLLEKQSDLVIVWPVHVNPKVRQVVHAAFENMPTVISERIYLTQPLNYSTMVWLLKKAWLVLTDSGGIQEESACLQLPVLILRETTERPELVQSGLGKLIGTDQETIVNNVQELIKNNKIYLNMRNAHNPFGDGFSAQRICEIIGREKIAA